MHVCVKQGGMGVYYVRDFPGNLPISVPYLLSLVNTCTGNCQDPTQASKADPKLSSASHKSQVSEILCDLNDCYSAVFVLGDSIPRLYLVSYPDP